MYETLLLSQSDHVATITFNRPSVMNTFDDVMSIELQAVTEAIQLDQSIRAVLLNGAGPLFMAGGDIQFFYKTLDTMPKGVQKIVRALNASIINLMRMPKPVLASVHGSVAGVGMSFMMAADLVIAAHNTQFKMAYSGIGISPDGGATFQLPRLVGTKKAMEWLLLSDLFDAPTARDAGLINWVVPADQLQDETQKIVRRLQTGPTVSFAKTKRLINETWYNNLESQLEREGEAFTACSKTQDFKAGIKSFLQKKKPEFIGE